MTSAVDDAELEPLVGCESRQERGALRLRGSELEVRRSRPAERAAAEQRATQVRTTAAAATDDAAWRARERRQPRAEDTGFVENLESALVAGDMQLIARRTVECASLVGADFRGDAEAPQQAEGAACNGGLGDVEMHRHLAAAAVMDAAGGVEEPRQLRQPVALAAWPDRSELVAELFRE